MTVILSFPPTVCLRLCRNVNKIIRNVFIHNSRADIEDSQLSSKVVRKQRIEPDFLNIPALTNLTLPPTAIKFSHFVEIFENAKPFAVFSEIFH